MVTAFAFLDPGRHRGADRAAAACPAQQQRGSRPASTTSSFSAMHGMTMIFLYALPILSGFSNYLWPLLLGSRDMALPRHNAFSYWKYLFSGLFLYAGFAIGAGPNDGWFNYVPYATKPYNPGPSQDFYALGFIFFGLSVTVGGINFPGDGVADARARHVDQPLSHDDLGNSHRVGRATFWRILVGQHCLLHAVDGPPVRHSLPLHRRGRRPARSCGSTCSGCSDIPGSMPSSCRRWAWCRTACRCSADGRWSDIPPSPLPPWSR